MTRQYARRQLRWLRRRFLSASSRAPSSRPPVYSVRSDDPTRWQEDCLGPAAELVEAVAEGRDPTMRPEAEEEEEEDPEAAASSSSVDDGPRVLRCEACDRDFLGEAQLRAHLGGRRHKKVVDRWEQEARPPPEGTVRKLENSAFAQTCDRNQ